MVDSMVLHYIQSNVIPLGVKPGCGATELIGVDDGIYLGWQTTEDRQIRELEQKSGMS